MSKRINYKEGDLITIPLPKGLEADYRKVHGTWRGISEPTPEVKSWLKHELGQD